MDMEVSNGKLKIKKEDIERVEQHFIEVCKRDSIKYNTKKFYDYQSTFFCGAMTAWNTSLIRWSIPMQFDRAIVTKEQFMDLEKLTTRELEVECHRRALNAGWHHDLHTKEPKPINVGEKLMLIVSEIGEAMEGDRKNLMDDKLPHRKMIEVELADAVIRIFDTSGLLGLNVTEAILEKMKYNAVRPDHKVENRKLEGGKQY